MLSNSLGQQHTYAAPTSSLEAVFKNMAQRRAYVCMKTLCITPEAMSQPRDYVIFVLFCFKKTVYTVLPLTATR